MDGSSCAGCSERDARIADLERRLSELEARLRTNASNSSTPPSANPLGADKPVKKKKSKRRRGGQPDHPPSQTFVATRARHPHRTDYSRRLRELPRPVAASGWAGRSATEALSNDRIAA